MTLVARCSFNFPSMLISHCLSQSACVCVQTEHNHTKPFPSNIVAVIVKWHWTIISFWEQKSEQNTTLCQWKKVVKCGVIKMWPIQFMFNSTSLESTRLINGSSFIEPFYSYIYPYLYLYRLVNHQSNFSVSFLSKSFYAFLSSSTSCQIYRKWTEENR